MPSYVINRISGKIRGCYLPPLLFSTSGNYIVDIPSIIQISPDSDSVVDLITDKINAFKILCPNLPYHITDEFINSYNVDIPNSTHIMAGVGKRTALMPGGTLLTNTVSITSPVTSVYMNWHGFTLDSVADSSNNPGPDSIRYNMDKQFVPSTFTVSLVNSTNTVVVANLPFRQESTVSIPIGSYRFRFINNDTNDIQYLSDWLLLHN